MAWEVEYTDEFENWWTSLTEIEQEDVVSYVRRLEDRGPNLPFPHSSGIAQSRHSHMRELRVQSHGDPFRVFYAFDPRRMAILLIGGAKAGSDHFYDELIPLADGLYDTHIDELKREGRIKS